MKRALITAFAIVSVMGTATAPAFANVVRPAGETTGQPSASVSNPGSSQGQANRSATGTTNKESHDGYRFIVG